MLTTSVTNYTHIPKTPDPWFCSRNIKFIRHFQYSADADGAPLGWVAGLRPACLQLQTPFADGWQREWGSCISKGHCAGSMRAGGPRTQACVTSAPDY